MRSPPISRAPRLQVRNSPKDAAAHNRLALKYVQAGRIQDAQARLDEALRLAPGDAEAHSNLGTVLQMQGRLAEATPHLETARKLKPNDDRIRFNLANGLTAPDDRTTRSRNSSAQSPSTPRTPTRISTSRCCSGPQNRLDEAIAHLRRVIELNSAERRGASQPLVRLRLAGEAGRGDRRGAHGAEDPAGLDGGAPAARSAACCAAGRRALSETSEETDHRGGTETRS